MYQFSEALIAVWGEAVAIYLYRCEINESLLKLCMLKVTNCFQIFHNFPFIEEIFFFFLKTELDVIGRVCHHAMSTLQPDFTWFWEWRSRLTSLECREQRLGAPVWKLALCPEPTPAEARPTRPVYQIAPSPWCFLQNQLSRFSFVFYLWCFKSHPERLRRCSGLLLFLNSKQENCLLKPVTFY